MLGSHYGEEHAVSYDGTAAVFPYIGGCGHGDTLWPSACAKALPFTSTAVPNKNATCVTENPKWSGIVRT